MRSWWMFLLVLALPMAARAGPEVELGAGGALSAPSGGLTASTRAGDATAGGFFGELRLGWRVDTHAAGLGLRGTFFPNVSSTTRALAVPHLYFREILHHELPGATVEVDLGVASVTHCGGDFCESVYLPATNIGFGLPLETGFGEVLFKLGLGFLVSNAAAGDLGPRLLPWAGLSYLLP